MSASLSSHILDTHLGQPATHISVLLKRLDKSADSSADNKTIGHSHSQPLTEQVLAKGTTNSDGRIAITDWQAIDGFDIATDMQPGRYSLTFDTQSYFEDQGLPVFYPQVIIDFMINDDSHYHIPLLLSAHGYNTYRGS